MFRKNKKTVMVITFLVCAISLLVAMVGLSSAAGPIWSQTGVSTGAAYRISLSPGYKTDRTAFWVRSDSDIYSTADGFSTWTSVYTTGDPLKRMQAVGVSPSFTNDSTVFGGSAKEEASGRGSVVKSINGGSSWAPLPLGSYSIIHAESVAYSPGYNDIGTGRVFIGTNKGGLSTNNGFGVVYSDNGGSSWNGSTGLPSDAGVVSIAVSPVFDTDHTVFAAVDKDNSTGSVYRSLDSGASWSKLSMAKVHAGSAFNAVGVAVSPDYLIDHTVFAVSQPQGLYRSSNGGNNWTALNGKPGLPDLPMSSVALSPNYANDHTLFVATDSQSPDRVFMSTDQGENWQEITTASENFDVYCLAVSPDYISDRALFVGTKSNGIWAYTGVIPTPVSTITAPVDGAAMTHGFVSYPITGTASCTDGIKTVEVSTDGGSTWHTASGTTSWSYSWDNPVTPDIYNIQSRATSSADVVETPSSGINVRIDRYTLTVTTVPADGSLGTVTKTPPSTPPYYDYNEVATLTAYPATGYVLKAWSGNTSGSDTPKTVTMTSDKSVTATFVAEDVFTLSFTQTGVKVDLHAVFKKAGVAQVGKVLKFYVSLRSPTTGIYGSYASKASGTVLADGTCNATIAKLAAGTYKLKAVYAATGQPTVASAELDCVIAPVIVPAQGVINPTVTSDPTPNLSWSALTGATGYVIQTCASSKFAVGTYAESPDLGNVTSADIPAGMSLPRGLKRFWRIIALLPTGRSVPSAARYITYKENTSFAGLDAHASGKTIQPSVTLVGVDGGIPSGKTVIFYYKLDTATSWSSTTAKTDTSGIAKLALPKTLTASGAYHLYAKFAGDTYYGTTTSDQVPFTLPTP